MAATRVTPASSRASCPLLDYAASRKAGEIAASACAEKAERHGWDKAGARACILTALEEVGDDMSGEALVEWARELGYEPHDDRAFGPIFASLLRAGLIVRVGECPRRKGNGTRGGSIYRLTRRAA